MGEVPPNSTTIGYLMTALHQKHKRQTFSPLQDPQGTKGPKIGPA